MKNTLICLLSLFVLSCSPKATDPMPVYVQSNGRVKVERIGVVEDDLAYDYRRGIYLITDTKTGIEYIGISGIGISEIGSHPVGKVIVTDER